MKLLHFSDLHVQLPDWRTRPLRQLGALRALATVELWKGRGKAYDDAADKLAAIARDADDLRADHCICTGDLTQLGMAEEFALARRALGPLAGDAERFTAIAGNHDRYHPGLPHFEEHFPEQDRSDLPGALRVRLLGEVALICLESPPSPSWPVLAHGRVLPAELAALRLMLARPELRSRCALVLVHHAPMRVHRAPIPWVQGAPTPDWPWHGLRGGRELLAACAEGGVQAVLCGHVHDRFDLPAAPGRARVICAGSSTERGHEGYWELEVQGARLVRASKRRIGGAPA